jgi:hypothetical protein
MKLLSRAARESITTTRKNGRFFDPARRKRIATIRLSLVDSTLALES